LHSIQLVGQVITCTNYTTERIFDFNPVLVQKAAETFLLCGVAEIELPQGVLDPDDKYPETGLDGAAMGETLSRLPAETRVIGTYLDARDLGADAGAYLRRQQRTLDLLTGRFPDLRYAMLHPGPKDLAGADDIRRMVEAYARLAEHARGLRSDFQLCFHNHYDSNGETADQVRTYLQAIAEVGTPALRWGVDTAHAHGMHADYLTVLSDYAHLVGDFFHIKGRIPAFDQLHEPAAYRADRDIWSNPAEVGSGLYGGFVNVADPEVETPLAEAFAILRRKARPTGGVVRGALEIDVPRQHPRLEVLCAALYLASAHGVRTTMRLSHDDLIRRVFPPEQRDGQ
jgi:sugar phosphate isomerase/epimerase